MAIYNGPMASKMRGKVGEIVAAKTVGGQTALRAYQPKVKNPNTKRQQVSRAKMSFASKIAATAAEAISIGFGAACKGLKMYPRNLFIRENLSMDLGAIICPHNEVVFDATKLLVSKASGFHATPNIVGESGEGTVVAKFRIVDWEELPHADDETVGLIVVAVDGAGKKCVVRKAVADELVQFNTSDLEGMSNVVYLAFAKCVPESLNDVPTEDAPWKYPGATSVTQVVTI